MINLEDFSKNKKREMEKQKRMRYGFSFHKYGVFTEVFVVEKEFGNGFVCGTV